jgi:hypothetical protein
MYRMAALPASAYEAANEEDRTRMRADRRKILASLPRGRATLDFLAANAENLVDSKEWIEDQLILVNEMPDGAHKTRIQQALRKQLETANKWSNMATVAARNGMDIAMKLYTPEATMPDMDDDTAKALRELIKKKEADQKKKEAQDSKVGWKGSSYKRPAPYAYKAGSYNSGTGVVSNWAIQQLLSQQLMQQQGAGSAGGGTGSAAAAAATAASGSSTQAPDPGYAARMMAGKMIYPCHGCGVVGHWKKDGTCKPADIAAHIKKRMAEKAATEAASKGADSDSGKQYCII